MQESCLDLIQLPPGAFYLINPRGIYRHSVLKQFIACLLDRWHLLEGGVHCHFCINWWEGNIYLRLGINWRKYSIRGKRNRHKLLYPVHLMFNIACYICPWCGTSQLIQCAYILCTLLIPKKFKYDLYLYLLVTVAQQNENFTYWLAVTGCLHTRYSDYHIPSSDTSLHANSLLLVEVRLVAPFVCFQFASTFEHLQI